MNQILAALIFFTRLPFWKIKRSSAGVFQTRCQLLEFQWLADRGNDGIDFLGSQYYSTSRSSRNPWH